MIPSTTNIVIIPVTQPQPATLTVYLILRGYLERSAASIHGCIVGVVVYCYAGVTFMEERVVMPRSALAFVIGTLLAFTEIKSQGQSGFPFTTHPQLIRFAVTSVVTYGLACVFELVVSAIGLDRNTCVFAIIVRLGKIGSLCVMAVSLACLFYL